MITDVTIPRVDFSKAWHALEALERASSRDRLCGVIAQLTQAVGMRHFLLLHLHGNDPDAVNCLDNLAWLPPLHSSAGRALVEASLARGLIPEIVADTGLSGIQHAIAASHQLGMASYVLLLGQDERIQVEDELQLLGVASLAAGHIATALAALLKRESTLSERELECLQLFGGGHTAKATGRHLGISPRTVEEYLARCRFRLGVETTIAAFAEAIRRGWMTYSEIDAASARVS